MDLNDIKCLEHSTLKVPYEVLNKRFRGSQKVIDREAAHVAQTGIEIENCLSSGNWRTSSVDGNVDGMTTDDFGTGSEIPGDTSKGQTDVTVPVSSQVVECQGPKVSAREVSALLGTLVERLATLKRKAGEAISEELEAAEMIRKRVQHLKQFDSEIQEQLMEAEGRKSTNASSASSAGAWKRNRLNRMLVDHLLREGMYDTASLLAQSLSVQHLTNVEVFGAAREVEESLKQHETQRMVIWCYENKSKLRKIHSTLEMEVRVQEFVELVRKGKRLEAVKHARKYLSEGQDPNHINAIKKCMGLLAFPIGSTNSAIHPYYDLLCDDRWDELIFRFRSDHSRIYQLSPTSVLGTVVQAGLASLKTANCYRATTKNPNCPVCSEPLSTLASLLPYAHCAHSQLVCAISGEPLNEHNPPMVLPSGYVYGTKSLREMGRTNGGKVICPRSGLVFSHSDAERVFVM